MLELEQQIQQEIRGWSSHALETPHPFFNDLPACPYAKKAWTDDRVGFVFSYSDEKQGLYTALSQFDDTFDVVCYVELFYEEDPETYHDYLDGINDAISMGIFIQKDLWVMGFHPEDDQDEEVFDQTFPHLVEDLYAITFVQRLSKLEIAAEKLREKGYYEQYMKDVSTANLWNKRQSLYRRLCDAGCEA